MQSHETSGGIHDEGALRPLFVPVPEGLAEVLGYEGECRFVAIFWSHEANDVVITDGVSRGVGESLRFLEYAGHPNVECELRDLNIGVFDRSATVWLVLDRLNRNLYSADAEAAKSLLSTQHRRNGQCIADTRLELAAEYADVLQDEDDEECARMLEELDRWCK